MGGRLAVNSMSDVYANGDSWPGDAIWQHLDYYVRRYSGRLLLVRTMLKLAPGALPNQGEIVTLYYELEELDLDWADAVLEQGDALEEGKSCDFVPPDEDITAFRRQQQ